MDRTVAQRYAKAVVGFYTSLSVRNRDVFVRRQLQPKRDTLERIAQDYDITRERVRQVEREAVALFERTVGPSAAALHAEVTATHGHVIDQSTFERVADVVAEQAPEPFGDDDRQFLQHMGEVSGQRTDMGNRARDSHAETVRVALQFVSGFVQVGTQFVSTVVMDAAQRASDLLADVSDEHRLVDVDRLFAECALPADADSPQIREWVVAHIGCSTFCGQTINRETIRAKVAAALAHIGRPATPEEIGQYVSQRRMATLLASTAGFERYSRDTWGLSSWAGSNGQQPILRPYRTCVQAIDEILDRNGGHAPVQQVVDELSGHDRPFTVSTLTAYTSTVRYVRKDGTLRYRQPHERAVPKVGGKNPTVNDDGSFSFDLTVKGINLHGGYSFHVPKYAAYVFGLEPDQSVLTTVAGHQVSFIWRSYAPTGPEMGRLRPALVEASVQPGDVVRLTVSRGHVTFEPLTVLAQRSSVRA